MASEVFRFVSVRPIASGAAAPPLDLGSPVADSDLIHALRDARTRADRAAMLASAAQFVASPAFLSRPTDVDQRLIALAQALAQLDEEGFDQAAATAVSHLLGQSPADYVTSDAYRTLLRRLAESVVAAAISPDVSAQSRALLAQIARVLAVMEGLAAGRTVGKRILFEGAVALPTGIFPLPRKDPGLAAERAAQRAARDKALADRQSKLAAYAAQLDAHRTAIDEIMTLLIRAPAGAGPPLPPTPAPVANLSPPSGSASDGAPRSPGASPSAAAVRTLPRGTGVGFWIGETARSSLSERTRSVLDSVGLSQGFDPIVAVQLIQGRLGDASRQLNASPPASKLIKVGSSIFPDTFIVEVDWPILPVDPDRNPGPCPPSQIDGGGDTGPVTVPTGHGEARVLGIADLMLVEQQLARYELGEIAHIENVLRKERRERRFRTSTTTETSVTTETEQTSDKEQDLSSTERFELQRQVQNVVNESASKQAGLTISGSYGPTVSATATANYTSNSSKQQSDSVSSSYARETTSRAVSRVQQRTLVRQFTQVVNRIAESNLHGFDNTGGSDDISGIYRFIDKIYTAQVLNYGKRLMLEFIVPEPAAFWRYALAKQPLDAVPYAQPDPPGYCLADGQTFVPLQAGDITADNYMFWASKYGAQDIQPPPAPLRVASADRKGPDQFPTAYAGGPNISSDIFEVPIPDGYLPSQAIISAYGETQSGVAQLVIQVQDQPPFIYVQPSGDLVPINLRQQPTPSIAIGLNSLRFHNYEVIATILCARDPDAFNAWALKTYFAVMQAYQAAKSKYDDGVEAARVAASYNLTVGRNPDENRAIEQAELKRGCITLMSGQRFDAFDSMARNVAPLGYPEIDFDGAKVEARFIRLFEQALEWENMTYLFYPYFWSRKDGWVTLVQLSDDDPLFNRFLQAGAARVQVPTRDGFHGTVLNYLAGVEVWDADGYLINPDDPGSGEINLSMLTELKSQLGNDYTDGPGTVKVTQGSDHLVGTGTSFTADDVNRRIRLASRIFVIRSVEGVDRITLTAPYDGASADAISYALGPLLVGGPWEIRVPTDLIKLGDYAIS